MLLIKQNWIIVPCRKRANTVFLGVRLLIKIMTKKSLRRRDVSNLQSGKDSHCPLWHTWKKTRRDCPQYTFISEPTGITFSNKVRRLHISIYFILSLKTQRILQTNFTVRYWSIDPHLTHHFHCDYRRVSSFRSQKMHDRHRRPSRYKYIMLYIWDMF